MTAAAQPLIIDELVARNEHQLELEKLYDKNQLMPRVRGAFKNCTSINFAQMIEKAEVNPDFAYDMLAQIAVHKRADVRTMVGCLRHHFDDAQMTATELEKAIKGELVTYLEKTKQFVVIYEITGAMQAELDMFQYPLPMVVQPRTLKKNLDSGYLTGKGSLILRDNHHDDDVCLDHLNRLNRTKFTLNLDTAKTIQNKWKGLDKKADDETFEDFQKYDRVAKEVIGTLLREGNELYLTHKYDKRGRSYCMGFHITYQGTDWNKSCIEFADKELLNET
jgi:DNA-directed RNA polymerase